MLSLFQLMDSTNVTFYFSVKPVTSEHVLQDLKYKKLSYIEEFIP